MKVLIACEYSGIVRDAFLQRGHDVISCDLLPTERPGPHYQGDVFDIINNGFDLMIAFPPCTFLTVSGNRHFLNNPDRWKSRLDAVVFVYRLLNAPIEKIAIENPVGVISSHIRKPDQIIHPYFFGDPLEKRTGLWLKNLPLLKYSDSENLFDKKTTVKPEVFLFNSKRTKSGKSKYSIQGTLGSGKGKERSVFFPGTAKAMAEQWG